MRRKRILSLALSVFMLVSTCMPATPIHAQNETPVSETELCVHHTAHTAECGYTEAVEGQPCTHVHDENCGYVEAVPEIPCDKDCMDTDGDGMVDHAEDCSYQPGVEAQPCTHVHDENCGYMESVAASPCTYAVNGCPYCVTAWSWVDPEGALAENDGNWGLGLPGTGEENPLTRDVLAQLLPQAVSATTDDGQIRDLTLTWDLTSIPEDGAVSGDYTVTAALPDGYDLVEGVPALTVLLSLGGAVSLGNTPGVDTLAEELPEESSYIVVQKTITGLTDEQIEYLKGHLKITVTGNNTAYTLTYGHTEDNILWREDGNTWAWRINGAEGGNYTVTEDGCNIEGTTLNATGTGSVNVAAADIGLEVRKATTCSHADWPLYDGKFFAGALTNRGVIVITSKSPSASQRQAIEAALLGGNWKAPVYYYSLDSLEPGQESYELSVQGRVLTYYPNETYDSESKPGKIVFSNTSEWTHVAEVTYNTEAIKLADIQINNDYTQPVTLNGATNLAVSKTMTGRDWKSTDSFTFTISAEGTNTPMPVSNTITISGSSANKTAHFDDITYTAPGTYVYTIRENASTVPGVSSDTTVYKVIVTVEKDENGLLHTSVAYQKSKDGLYQPFTYNGSLPFTNTYSATSATSKLNGHKHLTGKTLSANQFEFYIESVTVDKGETGAQEYTDYTVAKNAGVPLPSLVTGFGEDYTVANGTSGSASVYDIYFGDLTFTHTQAGHTYTYTIKEVQGTATGYAYDSNSKSVTYAVSLKTEDDNTQSVAVDVTKDDSSTNATDHGYFAFENSYAPLSCTAQPVVTKTLTGRDMLPDETFTFTLTANSRNPAGAALPANPTETVSGAKDGVAETVTFNAITFTKAGIYQFYIQETGWNGTSLPTDDTSGLTFDIRAISVTYTVTDVNGQLTVGEPVYGSNGSAINNTYAATGTLVGATNLRISKTLQDKNGGSVDWEAYQFNFTLAPVGTAPLPEVTILTLNQTKTSGNFGDIVYTQPGTYKYTISEVAPGYAGIHKDDTVYTVTVTVTDNGDGTLNVTPTYTATKGSNTTDFTYSNTTEMPFVNVQDVTTASVALRGSKTLDGHALANNQFRFYIDSVTVSESGQDTVYGGASSNTFDAAKTAGVPLPGNGLGESNAIPNTNTTGINFGSIIFDEHHIGKTYIYAIKEVQNNVNGYICDEATKTVTVAVTDADPALDKVVVQATVTKDTSALVTGNDYFVFNNTYTATGTLKGDTDLKISKTLTGRPWQDTDTFTFTISADNGVPLPTTTSVEVNSDNQTAHFGDISYTQKDAGKEYTYTISETKGTIAGITYSKASYQVTVTVTDNNDGTLAVNSVMKKLADDAGNALVPSVSVDDHTASFTNASDAKVTLFLKPADVITYMRGDQGYSGSVDDGGNADKDNTDMPKPMFYLTLNASSEDTEFQQNFQAELDKVDIAEAVTIQATGTDGNNREWKIELAGRDKNGQNLYYLSPVLTGQDPVRVKYTDSLGNAFVDDEFKPVTKLNTSFAINLYTGKVEMDSVKVSINSINAGSPAPYASTPVGMDSTGTGTLTVCFVEEENGNPTTGMAAEITAPVASGNGAVTADADTNYTLNNTTVPVDKDSVALLFDQIYDYGDGTTEMAKAFQARTDKALRALPAGWVRYYQAQYLDLVDVNNGNAWVLADKPVTVYWGYPEGTDQNTQFSLVHYVSLERQTSYVTADVENWENVETVDITKTENGICFTVDPDTDLSNFGPFVLVWEKSTVTPEPDDEEETAPAPTPAPTAKPTVTPTPAPVAAVIPQTGDDSQPILWVALVGISGVALAALAVYRKKRSDK